MANPNPNLNLSQVDMEKGIHFMHLNTCSLLSKNRFDLIRMQLMHSGLDVISLSETWLTNSIPNEVVNMGNYVLTRLDRSWFNEPNQSEFKRGGGLVCYIRSSIKFSDTKLAYLNHSSQDIEMQWISLNVDNIRPIVVVNVYRPPRGSYKKCCELLFDAMNRADVKNNTEFVILGDFNIDYFDKNSPAYKELDFTMKSLGLRQVINSSTRVARMGDRMTNTLLDLIFTNSDSIHTGTTLNLNVSDHLAVCASRKTSSTKKCKVKFRGRSYKNYVKEDFQESLLEHNWRNFFASNDPIFQWDFMENIIRTEADELCPIREYRLPEIREPWITNEAIEAIRDKDNLLKKAKKSNAKVDWDLAKEARNRVGRDLKTLRADFLKRQQEANWGDPKKFWKVVSEILPKKAKGRNDIWLKDQLKGHPITQENTPDYINSFFTNIGPSLASKFKGPWNYFGKTLDLEIEPFLIDTDDIIKLVREVKILKSSGMDDLPTRICRDAFLVLSQQLAHMFNSSIQTGTFPDKWKLAKIVPLFKGGDRENVSNYRPVSLLPLPGKLLEKIIHTQISNFFDTNEFLSNKQAGFRKGFSTVSSIADLTDELFRQINEGNTSIAAFVDLSKAFDTVNHDILIKKLHKAGIRNSLLDWCVNYLSNRSQKTIANNSVSSVKRISCGVPQGSVLGPLFFLVYINDLCDALDDCGIHLYTDDAVLYHSDPFHGQAAAKLQTSLDKFSSWCKSNSLTINCSKTKLMVFGSRSKVKKSKEHKDHRKWLSH